MKIDLNCDVGEGCANDAQLMKLITSANIACGYHAGDAETMRLTVDRALENRVRIGAHPGYPDRENFGRLAVKMSLHDVGEMVADQINALKQIAESNGGQLRHVKPHGALYNKAARDKALADTIASAIRTVDGDLILFGLSGSALIDAGKNAGLRTAAEVFADRTYQLDGSLTPRNEPQALIVDKERSIDQILQIVIDHRVETVDGPMIPINADTICIHGDGAHAVEFAEAIRKSLLTKGVEIAPFGY